MRWWLCFLSPFLFILSPSSRLPHSWRQNINGKEVLTFHLIRFPNWNSVNAFLHERCKRYCFLGGVVWEIYMSKFIILFNSLPLIMCISPRRVSMRKLVFTFHLLVWMNLCLSYNLYALLLYILFLPEIYLFAEEQNQRGDASMRISMKKMILNSTIQLCSNHFRFGFLFHILQK